MSINRLFVIVLCAASLIVACGKKTNPSREGPPPHNDEAHAEIDRTGRAGPTCLGPPLGTSIEIAGIRYEKAMGSRTLWVNAINGKPIETPITIWIDNIASVDSPQSGLPKGVQCVFRGHEEGGVIGCQPQSQFMHGFHRYFVVTEVVEPSSLTTKDGTPDQPVREEP